MRVPGPCLWWNSPPLANCRPFLRPLCGSEEHFENRKLSLEQGRPVAHRTTITISLHPIILSFTDPTHLGPTPHRTFHLSIRCQFTHLPPPGHASLYTFRLSFLPVPPCPSIHAVSTPSVVSRLSGQDEWQRCLADTCCFIVKRPHRLQRKICMYVCMYILYIYINPFSELTKFGLIIHDIPLQLPLNCAWVKWYKRKIYFRCILTFY